MLASVVLLVYLLLSTLSFGGGLVAGGAIGYGTWRHIGAGEFPAFHRAYASALGVRFAPALLFGTVAALLLPWVRDARVPLGLALAGAGLSAVILGATFFVMVPIHGRFARGKDEAQLRRLVWCDVGLRLGPGILLMGVNAAMLWGILRGG